MSKTVTELKIAYWLGGIKGVLNGISDKIENPEKNIQYRLLECMPDSEHKRALSIIYKCTFGKELDWDNLRSFSEKIQWIKLFDNSQIKTELADKILAREWVKKKTKKVGLVPMLGVWDSFDQIDFNLLPRQFVLKTNHGCGWNVIVKDKNKLDLEKTRKMFKHWMGLNYAYEQSLELQYKNIEPKIFAEKYLGEIDSKLTEYHIYCFNGNARLIEILIGEKGKRQSVITGINWEKEKIYNPNFKKIDGCKILKPKNAAELIEAANILAKDFTFVRVDFYSNNDDVIYFSEMTFTPRSGLGKYEPENADILLGDMLVLPNKEE